MVSDPIFMHSEIQKSLDQLAETVRLYAPESAVAFECFVNAGEQTATFRERTAEGLKRDGISMQNLAGRFIR